MVFLNMTPIWQIIIVNLVVLETTSIALRTYEKKGLVCPDKNISKTIQPTFSDVPTILPCFLPHPHSINLTEGSTRLHNVTFQTTGSTTHKLVAKLTERFITIHGFLILRCFQNTVLVHSYGISILRETVVQPSIAMTCHLPLFSDRHGKVTSAQ